MPVQISGHLKGSVNLRKVHLSLTLLTYPSKKRITKKEGKRDRKSQKSEDAKKETPSSQNQIFNLKKMFKSGLLGQSKDTRSSQIKVRCKSQKKKLTNPERRSFYQYFKSIMVESQFK